MRSIEKQVTSGQLVCPGTLQTLVFSADRQTLKASDGTQQYSVRSGVPDFTGNDVADLQEDPGSSQMVSEYSQLSQRKGRLSHRFKRWLQRDFRSRTSNDACSDVFGDLTDERLALSIGGGPTRAHESLCNINIGRFENVDVVADAHSLPYASGCVDVIFCEAVLEHLRHPEIAVAEMMRTLKPDGRVLSITPFLQAYHGYPSHFRNYTLTGHTVLFEDAGFVVERSGTSVGPVYTILNLTSTLLPILFPGKIGRILRKASLVAFAPLQPLDRVINGKPDAHVMASTTFVVARKPA